METKICFTCKRELPLFNFTKNVSKKDKLEIYCRDCNKERLKRNYYKFQRKKILASRKVRKRRTQWERTYAGILRRCSPSGEYAQKGIKNYLSPMELMDLWHRDKGWELRKPSIDRKNPKGHYTYSNCRYIELSENSRLARKKKSGVL